MENIKFEILRSCDLKLYPLVGEFIGVIDLNEIPSIFPKSRCETIIVLDRSGSMGESIETIINKILPEFFKELQYSTHESIHIITFDTVVEYFNPTIESLKKLNIKCQGGTYMSKAIIELQKLLEKFKNENVDAVRLLSISDGEIADKRNVLKLSEELTKFAKETEISINSQAIRFFTLENVQPDTTALCCLLQLNNVTVPNLLDISAAETFDVIIDKWTELFANDEYGHTVKLQCSSQIIRRHPWYKASSNIFRLKKGNNVFWIKEVPGSIKINGIDLKIIIEPQMSYENFYSIVKQKLKFIVDHLKILKIIQTEGKNCYTIFFKFFINNFI